MLTGETITSKMMPFVSKVVVRPFESLYRNFPPVLRIETTNMCNANCITCPRDKMTRRLGVMKMDLYERVIWECARHKIKCMHLHNFGEPLLDKHICERIRMAKGSGIPYVKMFSNASLLTDENVIGLIESGLDEIKISIDGHSKETFERVRRGLKYDQVVNNISNVVQLKMKQEKTNPKIVLNFVKTNETSGEVDAFVERWEGKVDKIDISGVHNWGINHFVQAKRLSMHKPCLRIWNTFTILWDGRVALCCLDYDGQVILGHVEEQKIKEIWQGDKLKRIRRWHIQGNLDNIPICRDCSKSRF